MLAIFSASLSAQKVTVNGTVTDGAGEPLTGASVKLMHPDSTQAAGASVDAEGAFKLPSVKAGSYILRVSYVGFFAQYKNLNLDKNNKKYDVGRIILRENAKLMREAEVSAAAAQVEMKADTFIYNTAAYRLPEGANLEAFLKKVPGAEISDEGVIKINGKEVKRIMVDGKEFFGNDTKLALKNLPAKMVDKVKTYDRQSDYSRITGIDDGEEETVLDLTVKKGMKEGWIVNADLSYGSEDRYYEKLNVSRFLDHSQYSILGQANNVGDRGWGGFRGWGGGGLTANKMAGANFAWENGKDENDGGFFEVGGNVRYNHSSTDNRNVTNSETFLTSSTSQFVNSLSQSFGSTSRVDADFRLEWKPDSLTNIMFRPSVNYNKNNSSSYNNSVTFNNDPYAAGMSDPLNEYDLFYDKDSIRVNSNRRQNLGEGSSYSVNGNLQVNRRLYKAGRNVTLDLSGGASDSKNKSWNRSLIHYYNSKQQGKPYTFNNQYNNNPSENWNYRARLSYSEPIFKGANLQFSYQFQRRYSDSDRSLMASVTEHLATAFDGMTDDEVATRIYQGYLGGIDTLQLKLDMQNSQYATYNEFNHDASVMLRYQVGDLWFNAGLSFQPQTTHMDYAKNMLDTTIVRNVFNWSPRVNLRWKISNTSQWRLNYNGRMSQPSMTNLLDVTDTSDPLNISHGNPGLKPSWTNRFWTFYNGYETERQMGWMVNAGFSQTSNSISTRVIYDPETGRRETTPDNINGNWNANLNLMFNTALGAQKYWNVMNFARLNHSNNVGYMQASASASSVKATTKTTSVGDNMRLNFRNDLFEIGVNGGLDYSHSRNTINSNADLDTWNFNYGGNFQINLPWDMTLSTDISQQSRRGYADASMNTNELVWNMQLQQSFLKDNSLTLSVEWFDILRNRSNISRSIDATRRSDSWSNAINSYFMVHAIYQLNLLGNKEARMQMGPMGGPGGPGPGGPGGNRSGNRSGNRGGGFGGPGGRR